MLSLSAGPRGLHDEGEGGCHQDPTQPRSQTYLVLPHRPGWGPGPCGGWGTPLPWRHGFAELQAVSVGSAFGVQGAEGCWVGGGQRTLSLAALSVLLRTLHVPTCLQRERPRGPAVFHLNGVTAKPCRWPLLAPQVHACSPCPEPPSHAVGRRPRLPGHPLTWQAEPAPPSALPVPLSSAFPPDIRAGDALTCSLL